MNSAPDQSRTCVACDYEGDTTADLCPRCGVKMLSAASIRGRGWAMIIVGLIMAFVMVVLILKEANRGYYSGGRGELGQITDDGGMRGFLFAFLGFFLTFGIVCFANGVWQIKHGRPHPELRAITFALFFVFMTVAVIISYIR